MARFLFSLLLVLVLNSYSHLVMSKRESHKAPDHHNSSQNINFSASTSQKNVLKLQNSSSSYSLSQLDPLFQTPSSSSAAAMLGIHTRQTTTTSTHPTINESGNDGGIRNFNDFIVPADSVSLPQPVVTNLSKSRYRRGVSSFWSFLVSGKKS